MKASGLKNRYEKLIGFEKEIEKEAKKSESRTVCGFNVGDGPCNVCMYRERCDSMIDSEAHRVWQMRSLLYMAYKDLERELREFIDENEPDENAGREVKCLLARTIRRLAASRTVLSDERLDLARESESIFEQLYYSTGDPEYRDEAESSRSMCQRIASENRIIEI